MDSNNKKEKKSVASDTGSAKKAIEPGFLGGDGGGETPSGLNSDAKDELKDAEEGASGDLNDGDSETEDEKAGGGLYRAGAVAGAGAGAVAGAALSKGKLGKGLFKGKLAKSSAAIFVVFIILIVGVSALIVNIPSILIGAIDYNLQDALGFTGTTGILEKQSEYIAAEMMTEGRFPSELADDLASNGIFVGQVDSIGRFIRTNNYLANIDDLKEVAAVDDNYYAKGAEGELSILFKEKVIDAENFVAVLESNPEMYAAYSKSLDISAKYYYSQDVEKKLREMGITRGAFNGWQSTGDAKADEESFRETLNKMLDNDSELLIDGVSMIVGNEDGEETEESSEGRYEKNGSKGDGSHYVENISTAEDPEVIIESARGKTSGKGTEDATARAAELLNTAISAGEPYRAASAFMAVEEPIQAARIDGKPGANEIMNILSESNEVTYVDINTNEEVTVRKSILESDNFVAAVSGGKYNRNEAKNFQCDRILFATNSDKYGDMDNVIKKDTAISTEGKKKSRSVVMSEGSEEAGDDLNRSKSSVEIAVVKSNSELFPSIVGSNRIPEGGGYLSNSINLSVMGAMQSDENTIMAYHHEVEEIIARRAEAERATKSPFDITSPYTFMGSLVHNFGKVAIKYYPSFKNNTLASTIGAVANFSNNSIASLTSNTSADGEDEDYITTMGDCLVVKQAANVEGDLYCNSHNTVYTGYMEKNEDDWKDTLGNNLDEDGEIVDDSKLAEFIALGMERVAKVGIKSADVCRRAKDMRNSSFVNKVLDAVGLYESCSLTEGGEDIATGAKYTLSDSNEYKTEVEKFSGYVLYDEVRSLMEGTQSNVAVFKERYYKEHPIDNSESGYIARISGMTKEEAQIAINYSEYLTRIARYNPNTRYAFGEKMFKDDATILEQTVKYVENDIYLAWFSRVEYADVRNRNFVV